MEKVFNVFISMASGDKINFKMLEGEKDSLTRIICTSEDIIYFENNILIIKYIESIIIEEVKDRLIADTHRRIKAESMKDYNSAAAAA